MPGPVLLAIETSTSRGGVAVVALDLPDGRTAARTYDGTRGHAEDLLFAVEAALGDAGATVADVTVVAVSVGPGSFTGVRVGVSTAKGLALARGVTLVAATSLEIVAAARSIVAGTRVALLDAKRGEVYAAAFDHALETVGEPALLRVEALPAWLASLPAPVVVLGDADLVDAGAAAAARAPSLPDPLVLAALGVARLRAGRAIDAALLEPVYLRAPDVTLPASRGLPIG